MISRISLAEHLTSGLSGWQQLQFAQNLGKLSGEDTARNLIAQIVNAQGRFAPATSQLPPNWGITKKRVDIALLGRSANSVSWYGSIEVKWPGESFDPDQVREDIIQDAMRVTFIKTVVLNANFVLLGGSTEAIASLFDVPHPQSADREKRRLLFGSLFSRSLANPDGSLNFSQWSPAFKKAGERVPQTVFSGFSGKIKATLIAKAESIFGQGNPVGNVYVWQCNRTKGKSGP